MGPGESHQLADQLCWGAEGLVSATAVALPQGAVPHSDSHFANVLPPS
jgi:hypothetical protein